MLHAGYDRLHDRSWMNVEWFLRDGSCWRRRQERVDQVRAQDATSFFKNDPMIRPGCRRFYLARKSP
jgi:hypothetical protein